MKTPNWFIKKNFIAIILLPLSLLYFFISKLVFIFWSFWQKSSKTPVICVGGLLAGGVGKTPIVLQIAKKLKSPVIMRGYMGGDEAKMLSEKGVKVFTGNRKNNINFINKNIKAHTIIMDDGFSNPTIKKDISVLVFDGKIFNGNGFLLPAGPMREPLCAILRSDAIIIIGKNNKIKEKLKKYKKPIFFAENKNIFPKKLKKNIIAFAGIGYPSKFFNNLNIKPIKTISFPDHYQYKEQDIKNLLNLAKKNNADLITTEKDFVRLPNYAQKKIKVVKLETIIEEKFWKFIKEKLNEKIG
ncbi:MAG: tetraacyldisaccharide 4'-kinase [Rickettsiales bacterium]|jgi:tetraacyldisaccharide 4'-kinase|nr:tetraacyldisaccharide 4'-kinase [Rickettsiales bacterium]